MTKNKYSNFWIGDNFFDSNRFDEESINTTDVMALASCKRAVSNFVNIVTNKDKAENFKLMKTPIGKTAQENWVDVLPHREDVLLEDIDIFKDYLVVVNVN